MATTKVSKGVVKDEAITLPKLSASATEADNVLSRVAKVSVNFNGTGTVAIRDSLNVSSITDHGPGDYTVNFTVPFDDANFSPIVTTESNSNLSSSQIGKHPSFPLTTSTFRIRNIINSGLLDIHYVFCVIFSNN